MGDGGGGGGAGRAAPWAGAASVAERWGAAPAVRGVGGRRLRAPAPGAKPLLPAGAPGEVPPRAPAGAGRGGGQGRRAGRRREGRRREGRRRERHGGRDGRRRRGRDRRFARRRGRGGGVGHRRRGHVRHRRPAGGQRGEGLRCLDRPGGLGRLSGRGRRGGARAAGAPAGHARPARHVLRPLAIRSAACAATVCAPSTASLSGYRGWPGREPEEATTAPPPPRKHQGQSHHRGRQRGETRAATARRARGAAPEGAGAGRAGRVARLRHAGPHPLSGIRAGRLQRQRLHRHRRKQAGAAGRTPQPGTRPAPLPETPRRAGEARAASRACA